MNTTHSRPERLGYEQWTLEQARDRGIPMRAIRTCIQSPESRIPAMAGREPWSGRGLTCIVNTIDRTVLTVYSDYRALMRPIRPLANSVAGLKATHLKGNEHG